MTDDISSENQPIWPLPKFHFLVSISGQNEPVYFQEISGLDMETQVIEYRHSDSPVFSPIKMPSISKSGNITLKRGIFVKDNNFYNWLVSPTMNTFKRETIVIKLLDEKGNTVMSWTLNDAWPTRITGTDLHSDSNEVAVESLELAYETITTHQTP